MADPFLAVGERRAAIDLTIVVEHGVAIVEPARAIRRNVIGSIERMTGLEVVEVNISVVDLQLSGEKEKSARSNNSVSVTAIPPTCHGSPTSPPEGVEGSCVR